MRLIVGLGNPGQSYLETRHNAGFLFLDYLVDYYELSDYKAKHLGGFTEGVFQVKDEARRIFFLKPLTFMNLSGNSVQAAVNFLKIDPSEILVIHDDIDVPFGKVKMKQGGGNAGHNGLKSIERTLKTSDFWRLRIGVGRPSEEKDATSHVLGRFTKLEFNLLEQLCHPMALNFTSLLEKDPASFLAGVGTEEKKEKRNAP